MPAAVEYPHLTIAADGVARIDGTRYAVRHLAAEHYAYGWTAEELLRQHPELRPQQVYAALAYFYDHFDAMVADLQASSLQSGVAASRQTLTRAELLRRRDTAGT